MNRTPRLLAGALVLALPLGAAAGCGAEKKKTVRQEFDSAQSNLGDSTSASFTLRFDDAQGSFAKLLAKDDTPAPLVQALAKGSITYVADPAGDKTLRDVQAGASSTDLKTAFKASNLAFVVRDDKTELLELRLVDGDLYAHVDLDEVNRLVKAGGGDDIDTSLDEFVQGAPPAFAKALTDVRAGKWLKLPLSQYADKLKGLADSVVPGGVPTASALDAQGLGKRVVDAVKPYVKVTDANDDSQDRVLDVRVQAKPALKALLGVITSETSLPFGQLLKSSGEDPLAEIEKEVKDGEARGQIRLSNSHLKQLSVDLESIRQLAKDPGTDSLAGVRLLVDVDDSADEVQVPDDVSSVDLKALFDELLSAFTGELQS